MADEDLTIWLRPQRRQRGPRPAYTLEQIGAAAMQIADKDGLDAVSMRRVAAELGCGTMSLYRYVASRDDIVALMLDIAVQEMDLPQWPTDGWRSDLTLFAQRSRAMMRRHPWMARADAMRPFWAPGHLRVVEFGIGTLDRFGLPIDQVMVLFDILNGFVNTHMQRELAVAELERRTGRTTEQLMARHGPYIRELVFDGEHPTLKRIVIDAQQPHQTVDEQFEYGLRQVLDTIAAALGDAAQ